MLLRALVDTADTVAASGARLQKVAALAELLRRLDPDEVPVAVGLLLAKPRQGRIGVGWRTLAALDVPHAAEPTLTLTDVDAAFERLAAAEGAGSATLRRDGLTALSTQATPAEWDFLARVLRGELRTGALDGVLLDAVAAASGSPGALVRRAAMLGGDLGDTARLALTGTAADLAAVGLAVGRPVLPMLAATAGSVTEALTELGTAASVEVKLDGARIQVHRDGDDVRVYTRSLAEITHRVPEIVETVRMLPARGPSSTARPSPSTRTARPGRSRTRWPGSARARGARKCCGRGSSTSCTWTGGICSTSRSHCGARCSRARSATPSSRAS